MEKTERNASICFSFQKYESIRSIAKYIGISEATVREILIRKLGAKLYLEIRKAKIKKTAKKYNYAKYISKRKIYATNTTEDAKRNGKKRSNGSLHT